MSGDSAGSGCALDAAAADPVIFGWQYPDELDRALRALWEGTVGWPSPAPLKVTAMRMHLPRTVAIVLVLVSALAGCGAKDKPADVVRPCNWRR